MTAAFASSIGVGGISCRGCDAKLPLRLTNAGESPALWECINCSARVAGIMLPEMPADMMSRILLSSVHFDTSQSPPLPDSVRALVNSLANAETKTPKRERRRYVRIPKQLEVAVAPLDEQFAPKQQAFTAMVHNLSEGGVGLISPRRIHAPHVGILLSPQRPGVLQVFGRIVRSRSLKSDNLAEIGVELLFRLGGRLD